MNVHKKIIALALAALVVAPAFAQEEMVKAQPKVTTELTEKQKNRIMAKTLFWCIICPPLIALLPLVVAGSVISEIDTEPKKETQEQVPVTLDEHGLETCEVNNLTI